MQTVRGGSLQLLHSLEHGALWSVLPTEHSMARLSVFFREWRVVLVPVSPCFGSFVGFKRRDMSLPRSTSKRKISLCFCVVGFLAGAATEPQHHLRSIPPDSPVSSLFSMSAELSMFFPRRGWILQSAPCYMHRDLL